MYMANVLYILQVDTVYEDFYMALEELLERKVVKVVAADPDMASWVKDGELETWYKDQHADDDLEEEEDDEE